MKDRGEGDDEGSGKGVMKVILSCLRGSDDELTDGRTDIGDCRVASATEKVSWFPDRIM